MAAHARLKIEFMEGDKYQNLMNRLIKVKKRSLFTENIQIWNTAKKEKKKRKRR